MNYPRSPINTTVHILQWNVRGVISHYHEFKNEILQRNPILAAIQETHFRDRDLGFPINGYSWYCNNVNSEHRSGVLQSWSGIIFRIVWSS